MWQKLCFVAKATYMTIRGLPYHDDVISNIPLLHAIIECGAHTSLVEYVITLYPDQVLFRDDDGRVPLSVASAKVDCNTETLELLLKKDACDDKRVTTTISAAAMADNKNRLPLHLAVESGRTWNNGVQLIADAAPLALQTCDGLTRMYPYMLAAIPNYRWDNTCIDTIYTLIRKVPHIIQKHS